MKNQLKRSTLASDPTALYKGLTVNTEMISTPRMKTVMMLAFENPNRVKIRPTPVAAMRSRRIAMTVRSSTIVKPLFSFVFIAALLNPRPARC